MRDSTPSSQERPASSSGVSGSRKPGNAPRTSSGFFCQCSARKRFVVMPRNDMARVYHVGVKAGIDPQLLVSQVKNTAAWLWEDTRARAVTGVFDRIEEVERERSGLGYFRLMLASHFATVATFVPTD